MAEVQTQHGAAAARRTATAIAAYLKAVPPHPNGYPAAAQRAGPSELRCGTAPLAVAEELEAVLEEDVVVAGEFFAGRDVAQGDGLILHEKPKFGSSAWFM